MAFPADFGRAGRILTDCKVRWAYDWPVDLERGWAMGREGTQKAWMDDDLAVIVQRLNIMC